MCEVEGGVYKDSCYEGVCSRTIASNYTEVTGEEGVVFPEGRGGKNRTQESTLGSKYEVAS